MTVHHDLIVYDTEGNVLTYIPDPIALQYSRSLNAIDVLAFQLPPGHHAIEHCRDFHRVEVKRDGDTDFTGLIMMTDAATLEPFTVEADSLERVLAMTSMPWAQNTANRTVFDDTTTIESLVQTLVDFNVGAEATTANSRWANGVRNNPPWNRPTVTQMGALAWQTSSSGSLWNELLKVSQVQQAVFQVGIDNSWNAQLEWRARPWGTNAEFRLTDATGGNLQRLRFRENHRSTLSRVVVRTGRRDDVRGQSVERSGPGQARLNESLAALNDTSISPTSWGIQKLTESQKSLFAIELELLPQAQEFYKDLWDLGDRLWVDIPDDEPVQVDIDAVNILVQEGGSEQIDIHVTAEYGGYYA